MTEDNGQVTAKKLQALDEALWHQALALQGHDEQTTIGWYLRENPRLGGKTPYQLVKDGGTAVADKLTGEIIHYLRVQAEEKELRPIINPDHQE